MTDPTTPGTPATPAPSEPAATPAAAPAAAPTPAVAPAAAAPAAAATPPPVAPTPAAGSTGGPAKPGPKLKPAVAIGAIVGAVALVGGGVALFGGSKDSDPRPEIGAEGAVPTVPFGVEPLDPTVGPQPLPPVATVPPPGPGVDPVITTTTLPPTTVGPPVTPAQPSGSTVEVGDGVSVTPAAGFTLATQSGGYVQLDATSGTAQVFLSLFDSSIGKTLEEVNANYFTNAVAPYVSEIQTNGLQTVAPVSANVVSNGLIEYKGVLAGQNGNIPIEGFIAIFIRSDGSVVIYEENNVEGSYGEHEAAFKSMLSSLIPTL